MSELRWELLGVAIGMVILAYGIAGLLFFFYQRKTADRSLVLFSLFALLYATRLILRQWLAQYLLPALAAFWRSVDPIVDNFIVVPLTLFVIEVIPERWKRFLQWVMAVQIAFAALRTCSQLLGFWRGPIEVTYHVLIVTYCAVLVLPISFSWGQRMPREWKVVYAGFLVFGLFVARNNLLGLGIGRGRDIESIGFLVLICCLGYLAASRTQSKERELISLQKELEIARQIQSSILPREVPRIAGLDIAAKYVPMTAVAGDFYDFLALDEKRVGILVADVTGHGVPAALIASMLKTALAAQSAVASEPSQVLAGLNQSLCGKFETHFVTAGYLFVDMEKQILRYGGAGHPPMMFGALNGNAAEFREIEANGMLLGMFEQAAYASLELPFRPGDRCVLYTDGVIETKNGAQEEFGAKRFLRFLEAASRLTAARLIAESLVELTRWSGKGEHGAREDDITLVAVNFEAAPVDYSE